MLWRLLREAQFHGARRLACSEFRWWWIAALSVLFCCALTVLFVTIQRFLQNPTFVVQVEVTDVGRPFPSVTICPEVDFMQERIEDVVRQLKYPPGLNASFARAGMRQLAAFFSPDVQYRLLDLIKLQHLVSYNDIDFEQLGERLSVSCEETFLRCRWMGRNVNCSSFFKMELTNYGFCCAFNGRSLRREMKKKLGSYLRPNIETDLVGFPNSLMLALKQEQAPGDLELAYKWLAVHSGQKYLDIMSDGTPISPKQELWAGYVSKVLQVAEDARELNNELRRCRMGTEPLQYFPIYHRSYCLLECEMQRTVTRCGCTQWTHLKLPDIPHCLALQLDCARQAAESFFRDECNCPPACDNHLDYAVLSSFNLIENTPTLDDFYEGLDFNRTSVIRVFVMKNDNRVNLRCSYFQITELISQLGGVFNVFFGCSMLTMLEVAQIVYLLIRRRRIS